MTVYQRIPIPSDVPGWRNSASVARHVPFVDSPSGYYRILPSSCRHLGGFGASRGRISRGLTLEIDSYSRDDSYGSYGKEVLHITWSVLKWTGMSKKVSLHGSAVLARKFRVSELIDFFFRIFQPHWLHMWCRKFKCFRLKSPCLDVFPSFKITTRLVSLARITPKSWQIILYYT